MAAGKEETRRARLTYLASPYTHADPAVMESRFCFACAGAAYLMRMGVVVFSPIAHSHPVSRHMPAAFATDHEFWMHQCLPMVAVCDELRILRIPGWDTSRGVARERDEAIRLGKPVKFLDPTFIGGVKC